MTTRTPVPRGSRGPLIVPVRAGSSTPQGFTALLSGLMVLLALACAPVQRLDGHIGHIEQTLLAAEAAGAMRCAPRQLAVARSHLAFALMEREQGFLSRAMQHLEVADEHAKAAQLLSPAAFCVSRAQANDE